MTKNNRVQKDVNAVIEGVLKGMREFGPIHRSYRYFRGTNGQRLAERSYRTKYAGGSVALRVTGISGKPTIFRAFLEFHHAGDNQPVLVLIFNVGDKHTFWRTDAIKLGWHERIPKNAPLIPALVRITRLTSLKRDMNYELAQQVGYNNPWPQARPVLRAIRYGEIHLSQDGKRAFDA